VLDVARGESAPAEADGDGEYTPSWPSRGEVSGECGPEPGRDVGSKLSKVRASGAGRPLLPFAPPALPTVERAEVPGPVPVPAPLAALRSGWLFALGKTACDAWGLVGATLRSEFNALEADPDGLLSVGDVWACRLFGNGAVDKLRRDTEGAKNSEAGRADLPVPAPAPTPIPEPTSEPCRRLSVRLNVLIASLFTRECILAASCCRNFRKCSDACPLIVRPCWEDRKSEAAELTGWFRCNVLVNASCAVVFEGERWVRVWTGERTVCSCCCSER